MLSFLELGGWFVVNIKPVIRGLDSAWRRRRIDSEVSLFDLSAGECFHKVAPCKSQVKSLRRVTCDLRLAIA
jgi:hypothetical protein